MNYIMTIVHATNSYIIYAEDGQAIESQLSWAFSLTKVGFDWFIQRLQNKIRNQTPSNTITVSISSLIPTLITGLYYDPYNGNTIIRTKLNALMYWHLCLVLCEDIITITLHVAVYAS